jgi:sterol desaturase/sphingolipid hydroxylase (fatty acid hydroxylase superfamily)
MNDQLIRIIIFVSTLLIFSLLEFKFEYRKRELKRTKRWLGNIGIVISSTLLMRIVAPFGLILFCNLASSSSFGLFNMLNIDYILEIILSVVLLDLVIYFQHRISHHFKFLWRIHRVHHADIDLDATSALRFHPLEIFISFIYKAFWILVFGISIDSIFIFEIILSSMAIFNHSNLYLPPSLERALRFIFVTPQMHIIHHSVIIKESDMNFGFNLSLWDRIFKTYKEKFSSDGTIGQKYYRTQDSHRFFKLLGLPFKNENNLK